MAPIFAHRVAGRRNSGAGDAAQKKRHAKPPGGGHDVKQHEYIFDRQHGVQELGRVYAASVRRNPNRQQRALYNTIFRRDKHTELTEPCAWR